MKFNDNDVSAIIHKVQEEKNTFIMGRTVKTQAAHFTNICVSTYWATLPHRIEWINLQSHNQGNTNLSSNPLWRSYLCIKHRCRTLQIKKSQAILLPVQSCILQTNTAYCSATTTLHNVTSQKKPIFISCIFLAVTKSQQVDQHYSSQKMQRACSSKTLAL